MASAIKEDFGAGGKNIGPATHGEPTVASALRDSADDMTELRAKFQAILVKLDAEGALGGGYVTAGTPATQKLTKG